jgi:hypothetical protein
METINQRLVKARQRAGYVTATEAAEAHGWKAPTYLAHENGTRGIRREKLKLYARTFRVTVDWLLNGGNPEPIGDGLDADRLAVLYGIKLGLKFAGIRPESAEWHEAIAQALREFDALPGDKLPATGLTKIQHRAN